MNDPIVYSSDTVALIGGSILTPADLNILQSLTQCFVGADGGGNHLLAAGIKPEAIIGDLDSLSKDARSTFAEVLHQVTEQDTTDFEKALTRIAAPLIIGAGFLGGRIDHTLSVFNVLARHPTIPTLLISEDDVCFLTSAALQLNLDVGLRIGLMPLAQTRVLTTGLRWNISDRDMHPTGMVSSSNEVADKKVCIQSSGTLLITLPRCALPAVIAAVRG